MQDVFSYNGCPEARHAAAGLAKTSMMQWEFSAASTRRQTGDRPFFSAVVVGYCLWQVWVWLWPNPPPPKGFSFCPIADGCPNAGPDAPIWEVWPNAGLGAPIAVGWPKGGEFDVERNALGFCPMPDG